MRQQKEVDGHHHSPCAEPSLTWPKVGDQHQKNARKQADEAGHEHASLDADAQQQPAATKGANDVGQRH